MCTEDESLSVDVYILLTEKRVIEILAASAEKVVRWMCVTVVIVVVGSGRKSYM